VLRFSRHALDQSIRRDISVGELEEALVGNIEIIEDYPDDKYGPSCLVLGYTSSGRALHVPCSYPSRPILKVITIYEPDESSPFKVVTPSSIISQDNADSPPAQ